MFRRGPSGRGQGTRMAFVRHPVSFLGTSLTTLSAILFLALSAALELGLLTNPYAGLVVFVALPALFVTGLLLILAGVALAHRYERRHPGQAPWPVLDFSRERTRLAVVAVLALTGVNVIILLLAGYGTLRWMESPSFCGQVCHTPMHPQYTAWQNAPHAQVACVSCHIGEGSAALVHYKLAGLRQLWHLTTGDYPRPIPAHADMRPAHETCGTCHWPGQSFGERLVVAHQYADDETNTDTATALMLQLGGPGVRTAAGSAIHWHADPTVRVEYMATDDGRHTIPWVKVTDPDGRDTEYRADGFTGDPAAMGVRKVMDCIDCHNVVAHRIATSAEAAVDAALTTGALPRSLPFVRREGVRLLRANYASEDAAVAAIEASLRRFYAARNDTANQDAVNEAVVGVQTLYRRNVFPSMRVTFGTYPDNLGHTASPGCFRCHDGNHTSANGATIRSDCDACHRLLDSAP